jgi:hypothetical protein
MQFSVFSFSFRFRLRCSERRAVNFRFNFSFKFKFRKFLLDQMDSDGFPFQFSASVTVSDPNQLTIIRFRFRFRFRSRFQTFCLSSVQSNQFQLQFGRFQGQKTSESPHIHLKIFTRLKISLRYPLISPRNYLTLTCCQKKIKIIRYSDFTILSLNSDHYRYFNLPCEWYFINSVNCSVRFHCA